MTWLLLIAATLTEVTATGCLKLSDGYSKLMPTLGATIGQVAAFTLMFLVLRRGMHRGVANGLWIASGIALVAIAGTALFHEPASWIQIAGTASVVGGVLALEMGAAH